MCGEHNVPCQTSPQRGCGRRGGGGTHTRFFKERFAKDASDAVRAESLHAIGKLGDPSTVAFLEQCAAVPSYRNLIATAAKEAIAAAGARH